MKNVLLVSIVAVLCLQSNAAFSLAARVDIGEALKRKIVRYDVTKVGSGIELEVVNLLHDSVYLKIEAGTIFPTGSDNYQPQVVTRSHMVCMADGEMRRARLNTVCGNAVKRSVPYGHTDFVRPVMGNSDLVALLGEFENMRLDQRFIVQNMVWHFTNNHPVSTFHAGGCGSDEYAAAMSVFHEVRPGAVDPGYRIRYYQSTDPDDAVFSDAAEEIEGHVHVKVNQATQCTLALLDENGNLLKPLKYITNQQPGEYNLSFKSNVFDLPKGNYSVVVMDVNGHTLGSLPVEI